MDELTKKKEDNEKKSNFKIQESLTVLLNFLNKNHSNYAIFELHHGNATTKVKFSIVKDELKALSETIH